jgi:GNAT superfamily N-acetyltransferase
MTTVTSLLRAAFIVTTFNLLPGRATGQALPWTRADSIVAIGRGQIGLKGYAWRDFMPRPGGKPPGSDLMVNLQIQSLDGRPLPNGLDLMLRGGPRWATNRTVDVPVDHHRVEPRKNVEIDVFRQEHARRFGELNREWLERYHLMEASEEEQLADPQKHFIDSGGQIFVALHDGHVIGTCAITPHGADEVELAKLTVASEYRGHGIARRLVERCIAYARERQVRRMMLLSNSQLQGAR